MSNIEEPYCLQFDQYVLQTCSAGKMHVMRNNLVSYCVGTVQLLDQQAMRYYFHRDRLLEAVEKWPWILDKDLTTYKEKEANAWKSDPWVKVP